MWIKKANAIKTRLSKEVDHGNIKLEQLKKSKKDIVTASFVKKIGSGINNMDKLRLKLVKKLGLAVASSDNTFKGKHTWDEIIEECEEACCFFCFHYNID